MSTPKKGTPIKNAPPSATDSPGTWRHPRLNEITRRREATTFSEKNVRRILYNIAWLFGLWTVQLLAKIYFSPQTVSPATRLYLSWAWTLVQLLPVGQILASCAPLFRARDDMADIPLTAAQRKLLGLGPAPPPAASSPVNPDLKFSTPPRYSRTPSLAGSVGSRGSYTNSPLSGRGGSPAALFQSPSGPGSADRGAGGSPFSPVESPLLQRSSSILGANNRRSSFGSGPGGLGSPFSASTSASFLGDPASPSPAGGGKRTSVGLNSKWLYEKGRRSSGSAWVH